MGYIEQKVSCKKTRSDEKKIKNKKLQAEKGEFWKCMNHDK